MGHTGPQDNGKGHYFTSWLRCNHLPAVLAYVQEYFYRHYSTWMRHHHTDKPDHVR